MKTATERPAALVRVVVRRVRSAGSRIVTVLSTYDTEPTELAVALWLLADGLHTAFYDVVASSPTYAYHAAVPRGVHAAAKLLAAVVILLGYTQPSQQAWHAPGGRRLRRTGALLALSIFAFDATAFLLANPASGAGVVFGVGAVMAAWCRVRLRLD